jgi:K(+)-stimulated pyrophosphate-energized sodium pump
MSISERRSRWPKLATLAAITAAFVFLASPTSTYASEAALRLPDFTKVDFHGINGHNLLLVGLAVSALGMAFGIAIYMQLKRLPVHRSMLEVSELIYATCRTYLVHQLKFILLLELFIGTVIFVYFGFLAKYEPAHAEGAAAVVAQTGYPMAQVFIILLFSLIGIAGSASVAFFGMRINTFANSRTSMAALQGKPFPVMSIPLRAGMSIGMVLISVELLLMLMILLFIPAHLAGPCFIGFAIGESLGAAALRVAGGIFTKIADIGADLMKIVFNVKEDDARNPGVIADCVGDNAGDSVGPTADGFETYGVTGVALISFILLAVHDPMVQAQLLVWIFAMRIVMVLVSGGSYLVNEAISKARYGNAREMDFEKPLVQLVWLTSLASIVFTFLASYLLIPQLGGDTTLWWKLATIISCGTFAGAVIPEVTTIFTSTHSRHVREVVTTSREGGASLNVLSGLTAGNFSAFWIGGVTIAGLMAVAYVVSLYGLHQLMEAEAVFAFGLVAFGFLGMGPVTIAVDSYGPVTDNAQSVYELSLIETLPNIEQEIERDFGFKPDFEHSKEMLEENDGAGNTFKATAKPVLIGTAVVGATTMIFSIVVLLSQQFARTPEEIAAGIFPKALYESMSILHAPFLLGLLMGGAVIYWFTGASTQAVITGAYRAVAFIKRNMRLDGAAKASTADSQKVVAICTKYAQKGMFNVFLGLFFITLSFAFVEPFFFIGFLIGLAFFGLFQAIFMANAGGAWDNAKKIVETELREKNTPLHAATVVGDTVGDPFKDTSSVAMNPIIKFSTLFGLLAVELSVTIDSLGVKWGLAAGFFLVAAVFVHRSFFAMRIQEPGSVSHESSQPTRREPVGAGV